MGNTQRAKKSTEANAFNEYVANHEYTMVTMVSLLSGTRITVLLI